MLKTVSSGSIARDPRAAMTLTQGEILAPIALLVANALIAAVDRVVRLFGRA